MLWGLTLPLNYICVQSTAAWPRVPDHGTQTLPHRIQPGVSCTLKSLIAVPSLVVNRIAPCQLLVSLITLNTIVLTPFLSVRLSALSVSFSKDRVPSNLTTSLPLRYTLP